VARSISPVCSSIARSAAVGASLEVVSKELALILERYLGAIWKECLAEAIPVLAIDQVIVDRVKSTSAELEVAIEGIVKMNCKRSSI